MQLIRPLVLVAMQSNIQFKAEHVPGIENEIAQKQWLEKQNYAQVLILQT
jgi:hypothetical protein